MITIDNPGYGERQEFATLIEAGNAISASGYAVSLSVNERGLVFNFDEHIGAVTPDIDPADSIAGHYADDE